MSMQPGTSTLAIDSAIHQFFPMPAAHSVTPSPLPLPDCPSKVLKSYCSQQVQSRCTLLCSRRSSCCSAAPEPCCQAASSRPWHCWSTCSGSSPGGGQQRPAEVAVQCLPAASSGTPAWLLTACQAAAAAAHAGSAAGWRRRLPAAMPAALGCRSCCHRRCPRSHRTRMPLSSCTLAA